VNPYIPPAIDDLLDDAFKHKIDRAVTVIAQLTTALGSGRHTITCASTQPEHQLSVALDLLINDEGVRFIPSQLPALTIAFALAFLPGHSIGIVSRSHHHEDGLDVVRGWSFTDGWPNPLTAEQVHHAYITDVLTGDLLPDDPQTRYAPGIPLLLPKARGQEGDGDDTALRPT
jgi:hypothetical protein